MTATNPAIEMNRALLRDLKAQEQDARAHLSGLTAQVTNVGQGLTDLGEKIASTEEAITLLVRAQQEKDDHPATVVNASAWAETPDF